MEQKIDLRSMLQDLGIKKVFTTDADLSAMTGDVQLQQNANTYLIQTQTHQSVLITNAWIQTWIEELIRSSKAQV